MGEEPNQTWEEFYRLKKQQELIYKFRSFSYSSGLPFKVEFDKDQLTLSLGNTVFIGNSYNEPYIYEQFLDFLIGKALKPEVFNNQLGQVVK